MPSHPSIGPNDGRHHRRLSAVIQGSKRPRTAEAHRRNGHFLCGRSEKAQEARKKGGSKGSRRGVPDGWGGRREELMRIHAAAEKKAYETVEEMDRAGMLDIVEEWREEAKVALAALIAILYAGVDRADIRLRAARLVLEFTMPKPVARRESKVGLAERWLKAID